MHGPVPRARDVANNFGPRLPPSVSQSVLPAALMTSSDHQSNKEIALDPYAMIRIQLHASGAQYGLMKWSAIRLELACGPQFPEGSPHRCYLLNVPLEAGGLLDEDSVRATPKRATVRRFWPSQADRRGNVIKTPEGWAFAYEPRREGHEMLFRMDVTPLRVGECITLTEPDGERLPFRVTAVH